MAIDRTWRIWLRTRDVVQKRDAIAGACIPAVHRIDGFSQFGQIRFVNAARVDPYPGIAQCFGERASTMDLPEATTVHISRAVSHATIVDFVPAPTMRQDAIGRKVRIVELAERE